MQERIVKFSTKYRRLSFIRVAYRTFTTIFPFVLIGTFCKIISNNLLQSDGFLYNVLYLADWTQASWLQPIEGGFHFLAQVLLNFIGLYVAYLAAYYTAQSYHREQQLAGVTGIAVILISAYQVGSRTNTFTSSMNWRLLSMQNILISLLIGYLVGQIFRWLSPAYDSGHRMHTFEIQSRVQWHLKPILASLTMAVIIGILMNLANYYAVIESFYTTLSDWGAGDSSFIVKVLIMMLISVLQWGGLYDPSNLWYSTTDSAKWNANLGYVLSHHSMYHVPYPFSGVEIFSAYAVYGGIGCSLALLVALVLVSRRAENLRVARWNAIPVLFNNSSSFFLGLPVILNPLFLLAMIVVPTVNIILASGALMVHLIPTPVFDFPNGTPAFLVSFIGTNGNWPSVIFAIILFVLDVMMYIPVVRIYVQVQTETMKLDREEDQQ